MPWYLRTATYTYFGLLKELVWDNETTDGKWSTANNWDPNPDIPDAITNAIVNNGTTATVTTGSQVAIGLTIENASSACRH